jgi:class 3 adenylate cyclase
VTRTAHELHDADMDARLKQAIADIGEDRWAGFAIDAEARLVWVSAELKGFLGATEDAQVGIGKHLINAFIEMPAWHGSLTPESGIEMFRTMWGYLDVLSDGVAPMPEVPADFQELVPERPTWPAGPPAVVTGSFQYIAPGQVAYPVEYLSAVLRGETGTLIGAIVVTNIGIRPSLLARLGRGDSSMYERMARVTEPGRHETAIVFADLEGSGALSRKLPTAAYFDVIRTLTAAFDASIADHFGIIGKHVGDGWTGFILAADTGGPSAAAAAAVAAVQGLQQQAAKLTASVAADLGSEFPLLINAGLHWGPGVYLGQLVPGGRLEVTALGDEVNESARIQECARGGRILASKQLMELLTAQDAAGIGVDPARLTYDRLAAMDTASEKVRRDAATLAVTAVPAADV